MVVQFVKERTFCGVVHGCDVIEWLYVYEACGRPYGVAHVGAAAYGA